MPRLSERNFEVASDDRVIAEGSWRPHPAGWVPFASVRIECDKSKASCDEFWAEFVADEEGGPGALLPEVTHYEIDEWNGSKIFASAVFRSKWPVRLEIDTEKKTILRRYAVHETYDAAEYWLLE
jgi:hypothetical protein